MSFIDTTKFASDDTLIALTGNVQRVLHEPTTKPGTTAMTGAVSFERIQPRSKHFGMKNITLTYTGQFTIKFTTASTRQIRLENINAALYDTNLNINGSIQFTQQPYINYYIKRSYDKGAFQEHQHIYNDKYVYATVNQTTANKVYVINYRCCTPIYHSFFESDLVGIDNMSILSQFNLYNIFKVIDNANSSLDTTGGATGITVENSEFKLRYDEIQYTMPMDAYNIQIPHYVYYQTDNSINPALTAAAGTTNINQIKTNIRDVRTQPLRVFYSVFPNIRKQDSSVIQTVETVFKGLRWDVNNKTNVMNTDTIEDVYLTSRCAGLLTEYETYCGGDMAHGAGGVSCPPVAAISMLDTTDSKISTSDLFRLSVEADIDFIHPALAAAENIERIGYAIYEYPAVLSISTISSQLIYSLPGTFNELVEMEDDETYLKQLEESGMYGGSKFGDWIKRTWNKIKSGRFISKALNFIGNTKGVNNLLSMIPGVGTAMPIISKIQDIAGEAGKKAEDAGYGVNMF